MGSLAAQDMIEHGGFDTALAWHLSHNHYPPVPSSMIEPCKAAIKAVTEGEDDRTIPLPPPVTYKDRTTAPAWAIVEGHHLQGFIDNYDEEE